MSELPCDEASYLGSRIISSSPAPKVLVCREHHIGHTDPLFHGLMRLDDSSDY